MKSRENPWNHFCAAGKIGHYLWEHHMTSTETDLRAQVEELKAENARLQKQLTDTRAQRAEYMQFISELIPPFDLPSEEEMAEPMKNLIPADQAIREMRERRKVRGSDGP
jgi:chromosome segregation ATPase